MDLERYGEAKVHLAAGRDIARAVGQKDRLVAFLGELAIAALRTGEIELAKASGREAMVVAEELERSDLIWIIGNTLGGILLRAGDQEGAMRSFEKAMAIANELGDRRAVVDLLNNIAVAHMELNQFTEAMGFLDRAREIVLELGDDGALATVLSNIAEVLNVTGQYERSREIHEEILLLREQLGSEADLAVTHSKLASALRGLGEYEAAVEHVGIAIEVLERLGLLPELAEALVVQAEIYRGCDRELDSIASARAGAELTEALGMKGHRLRALESLVDAHAATGDHEEALSVFREARRIEREIATLENRQALLRFHAEYEALEREREIEMLRKDVELGDLTLANERTVRNSILIGGGLFLAAAAVGWILFLTKRRALRALRAANALTVAKTEELEEALAHIDQLHGLLPLCSYCKSIRDDEGAWRPLETYLGDHTDVDFSHGICPKCAELHHGVVLADHREPTAG